MADDIKFPAPSGYTKFSGPPERTVNYYTEDQVREMILAERAWKAWQAVRHAVPAQAVAAEVKFDRRAEMERFNEWSWREASAPIGQMHGSVAALEAWMFRAQLKAAAEHPQAQGEHSAGVGDASCRGCDPAEGFCRSCRESEQKARSLSYAAILRIADEVAINSVTDERRPDNATIIAFARAIEAAAATAQGDGEHSGRAPVQVEATPAIRKVIENIATSSGEGWSDRDSDECWKELLAAAHKAQQERGQ